MFTGGGAVKDFIGNYTEYRSFIKDLEKTPVISTKAESRVEKSQTPVRKKRSWKEEREMVALEAEIAALNDEKASLEAALSSGTLDGEALRTASTRYGELNALLDEKETRWLELSLIG